MMFADTILAQRLEAADAWLKASYAEAQATLCPDLNAAVEWIGRGCAVYCGPGSPVSRAVGLGMNGPVGADELERVEQFFHSRGTRSLIELCPLAERSLADWLNDQGYHLVEFKNLWIWSLERGETFPVPPSGLKVRAAESSEAALWTRTVAHGFEGRDDLAPAGQEIARPNFSMTTATAFLAWLDGEPAGGGAMATHRGLASFFSASTRLAFRGRGAQTALLYARLAAAAAQGCDLAMVHTTPGNASQRNVERVGFRLVYTKVGLVREP